MSRQFPAIIVGGPPHSGKSVLTYSLSQALRQRHSAHYVLRACPDGEGDWNMEAQPETVRVLRAKGQFTTAFVDRVCRDLERRHLPLLVDVGGRPTAEQQRIFDFCTHAILVSSEPALLAEWRTIIERHGPTVIAELVSTLTGVNAIQSEFPTLSAEIAGLERFHAAEGPVFDALVDRVAAVFNFQEAEIREMHLHTAPVELTVDLDRLACALELLNADGRWHPHALRPLLEYLPAHEPLAIYGRGPGWLYAALSAHTSPAPFWQFDARLGWVQPIMFQRRRTDAEPWPIGWRVGGPEAQVPVLTAVVNGAYVDYSELEGMAVPDLDTGRGLIISGKLPHWVLTGLVRTFEDAPWLAAYQPQLGTNAIIVASRGHTRRVGDLEPLPPGTGDGAPDT
jgi:CRISPR-associated protein Csx3